LRALQDKDALTNILQRLQNLNNLQPNRKPLLLKIAPDLTTEQLQDIAKISSTVKLDGIVSSNTTISRENLSTPSQITANKIGMGGLSGKPLKKASDEVLKQLIEMTKGEIPIIASGGIFTAKDAEDKIKLGASLIQVWTGFIYEGPGLVKTISKNLIK
jgi:dihydroorotate dehydrogenase